MKNKVPSLLSFLLLCCGFAVGQNPSNPGLTAEIDRLFSIDQGVQNEIVTAFQNGAAPEKVNQLVRKEMETFKKNIPVLKEIIRKHGFPTYKLVGIEASKRFFVMVQHSDADIEFQKLCLKKAEKFVKTKQVSTENYAYLTDRVSINSGNPQVYGTQLDYDTAGKAVAKNVIDPINLNKRRASVGLGTIEDYLEMATKLHARQNKKN